MDRRIGTALAAGFLAIISAEAGASNLANPYLNHSCDDLARAAADVSRRADKDVGIKSDPSPNDAAETIISWPKAFFANVSGEKALDLSHLKKEMIAIEQASIDGQCEIQFVGPRPPGA